MNQNQARAIAKAVSFIRPDWQESSLSSLLTGLPAARRDMPARDVMLALVWLAYDPATKTPGRLIADGPWWHIADTAAHTQPAPTTSTVQWCDVHGRPYVAVCRYCRDGQPVRPRGGPPPPDVRAQMRADLAAAQDRPDLPQYPRDLIEGVAQ